MTWVARLPLLCTGVQDGEGVSGEPLAEPGVTRAPHSKAYRLTCVPAELCAGNETWITATPIQDVVLWTKQWIVYKDKRIWMNRLNRRTFHM